MVLLAVVNHLFSELPISKPIFQLELLAIAIGLEMLSFKYLVLLFPNNSNSSHLYTNYKVTGHLTVKIKKIQY